MPEAQRDFDKNVSKTTLTQMNLNSYERIETQHEINWSSTNSIDVSYIPLVSPQYDAQQTVKLSQPIQNVLASSEANNFCCCSGETRKFGSCWKTKRRQIIWESAHASAKNRTNAAAAANIRRRRVTTTTISAATGTPTLSESLLPTPKLTTTAAATNVDRKPEIALVNKRKGVSNISTSLPATPNLSHLQRRQYKKLSLECEDIVDSLTCQARQQVQEREQERGPQQLLMSATATKLQSYYRTSEEQQQNRAADQQQKSMLLRHEVIAIPATTATKEPACNARFVAKNNNINNNKKSKSSSNSNSNHNNGSLGTPCSNNSTQTQKDLALLSNNSAAVPAKHTKANKTTTTLAAKSSLAFCEHCCESASMLSSNSSSLLAHNKQHDRKAVAGDGFGMDADSVSDELSSFRLVSEEDSSNNSVYTATRSEEQVEEEDENRSPNIVPPEQQSCDKQAVVVASARSSSPATTAAATTTICCYTIGRASTHYSATNINQSVCPSAPVFITPTTLSEGVEVFHFADTASEQLSTSLPSNYGSVNSKAINNNDGIVPIQTRYCSIPKPTTTVKRKNAAPPVPPPKPPQRDQCVARTASTRSGNRAFTRLYYDPASFQRKLQKFEKQTKQTREINEAEHTECSSPEPCDLLNCFGAVKHIHPRDRVAIARSASDSSSCCTPSVTSENCVPNNSNNSVANTLPLSAACVSAIEKPCESNNNYNCKILHVAINNNNNNKQCQQHFSSSPALNKRTLRYDSCGRLKAERFYAATVTAGQKSLSESRLPQHLTSAICRKLSFRADSQSVPPPNGYVHVECANFKQTIPTRKKLPPLTPSTPNSPNSPISPISPNSPHSPLASTVSNSPQSHSEIDLSLIVEQQPEIQLFKSFSDTQNNNVLNTTTNESQAHQQHEQQQRCYSDYTLKTSNHQHSTESITFDGCNCATATPSATTTIAVIHQQNSVSLPSVSQPNGSQSPPWLSSETIASSRCDLKGSEDTQSVCSDQTTIFHLEQDCSSSSSPSSQSCGNVILRTPLILKRIPEIQSFGFLPTYSTQSLGNANEREQLEKELSMEKRRNTLDRFQRLGFGRKSSPSPSHAAAAAATAVANQESNSTTRNRKSSEKSERLKELTELLRGNRSSPTPPPVPPPRKPRNGSHSTPSSFEKPDKHSIVMQEETSAADGTPLSFMSTHSDDILLMDQEEQTTDAPVDGAQERKKSKDSHIKSSNAGEPLARSPPREHDTLKPNTSLSSFASLMLGREKSKSPPPIIQVDAELEASTDIDTKLTKPESRTIIGAYTQKGIPFRSASFSQIDYSSGKYKKSALSLLRDRLRRDKAVDRSPSPTVVANITLPRNREKVEEEPTRKEPDWIYIPLKKSELSINLNLNSLHKSLEDVAESPDALTEEDVFATDKEDIPVKKFDPAESQAAHAKMESLTDTIQSENDYTIDEEQLPVTVESGNMAETEQPSNAIFIRTIGTAEATPTESNLATLMEEEMPLESPPESFLQTATTCLIPVSVYECAAQDWRLENPPHEWVEVAPEEFGIIPETIEPLVSLEQCSVAQTETKSESTQRSDMVPTISVSRSSEEAEDKELLREKHDCIDGAVQPHDDTIVERRQASLDFPEVKKRYSQDDIEIGTEKRSSLDSIATRLSAEERKRLDKSRRRKGMYIDSTAWTEGAATANRGLALNITIANFNAIKADSPDECSSIMFLNSPITDENHTPGSLYSLDLNTPESECSKPPVWTKNQRLTSFSCQSSEEKDDTHSFGGGSTDAVAVVGVVGGPATVSLPRNNKSYPFLRTDSISDNESERTPPPSRDRTSASPSLSDNDFKRFSKRPLRGPYGQMLEAEMKKPNRMHFEEILEELRESEGISMQPRRQRNAHDGRSYEEPIGAGVTGGHLSSGTGRNMPQYSNSVRVRKTSTYLPVPSHARAASTPSQIENVTGKTNNNNTKNSMGGLDALDPQDQRCQSAQDNAMSRESHDSTIVDASQQKHQSQPQQQQMQPQPHPHPPQQQQHHLRDMKRAASEAPTSKPHHSKRSQSMSGEKPALHQHQQKRSLDVNNKSAAAATKQTTTSNLMPTQELLAELLKGSSEKLLSEQRQQMFADTRTHVVQEIFKNEQSYVESLQTVVMKYLKVLKSPEHAGMIDSRTVDEIFFMVPDILEIHEKFLSELRARLDNWDTHQKVGDAFMETFSKLEVLEVYTSFVNNCNRAKNAIRTTKHQRPSFAKFLETTAREHKGKLTLDNLLIKPVQKFPNYEMLFTRLIKHTDHDHPDQKHLQDVLKLVHDILVHINCKEREILENGQREATLRELEGVIEGITDLIAPERQFLLFDLVSMPSGQGARKERGFFLFNDLLVLTSIKKRSGTIRKPNTTTCPGTVASTLDTNKYKFLTKISLDCLDIVKTKDENLKRIMAEIENLAEDCNKLQQITDLTASLKYPHQYLEDVIRELHRDVQRQLSERQTNDAQLNMLELTVSSPNGSQKLSIVFSKAEKRSQWEETFNEAKQKLAATLERHPIPEFLTSIPIRKTRAGLQFTCAAATLSEKRDVWVCNSDGYVGQVCIMSLHPEPNVTSCNGVCNARILCVASVPAYSGSSNITQQPAHQHQHHHHHHHHSHQHHHHQHSDIQQQRDNRKSSSPNCQTPSVQGERRKQQVSATLAAPSGTTGSNSNSDIQLDLNLSSSDEEAEAALSIAGGSSISTERVPSPAPSTHTTASTSTASTAVMGSHQQQDSNPDESEGNQSTMWIGTEDGCIHVYNSTDNIRIKKNRIKIEHHSAVYSILYLDNRVFVSLANGDICVYLRDGVGWNTNSSHCISIGTVSSPISKLLSVHGKLWCSIQGIIKVLDIETLLVVNQIQISSDSKPITNMTVCNNYVWISIQNSAHIKCFHSNSHQLITEVNLAPAVNKMLSNCDEIIRQHKAACLRVTSLLSCKDLIWIGTSAGVLLTIPAQGYEKGAQNVVPTGIPHGHTGHVRFLTFVETTGTQIGASAATTTGASVAKDGENAASDVKSSSKHSKTKSEPNNILIISGGDGYEDFRNSGANSLSEIAGREDSTNHLLIWQI